VNDVVIVGGTGTLGKEIARQLLAEDDRTRITVLSRDELKQQDMRRDFPSVRYMIGDIRDQGSLLRAFRGASTVFHCAALKHVDLIENNALEAVKTNVLGTQNVISAALTQRVSRVVFSSTDKAVMPINVYGNTKAIGERLVLSANEDQWVSKFRVYRWGNVVGSRGSVIHGFAKSLREEGKIRITDVEMSRFWISIEEAVSYLLHTHIQAPEEVMIPPMKAASVIRFAAVVAGLLGVRNYGVEVTGKRPGEKVHEMIAPGLSSDTAPQYTDDELVRLIEPVLRMVEAAA
jgi:FlaA1/EpsC-like NDP-sugar epimerase